MASEPSATRVRIWDAATRLAHWLMVALVAASWWTAENGELEYHRYSGYTLLGLLVFRLYWGFAGSSTARFANFVRGPRAIWAYLRQMPLRVADRSDISTPGHNPLGALSVIVLLALMVAQVTLGLFAVDVDGIESGPLSHLVSFDAGRACAELHEGLFNILLTFIALHVVAVLFYLLYKRENLIATMIHGDRDYAAGESLKLSFASLPRLLIGIALAGFVVWFVTRGLQW
jgi:cytochrome b